MLVPKVSYLDIGFEYLVSDLKKLGWKFSHSLFSPTDVLVLHNGCPRTYRAYFLPGKKKIKVTGSEYSPGI